MYSSSSSHDKNKKKKRKGKERIIENEGKESEQGPVQTKRRKVTISRVYDGLDERTLQPKNPAHTLSDVVEDIEEYEIEELYPRREQSEEKEESITQYTLWQTPVSVTRTVISSHSGSSEEEEEGEGEGEELSFGQNIQSFTEGDIAILVPENDQEREKDVLDQYDKELDASASPRLAQKTQQQLLRNNPHRDYYGSRSYTGEEAELLEKTDYRSVRNAFSQVPGRPNCYTFGAYEGKGFSGCGVVDPFSLPVMYERHDFHMWTWDNDVYDYMTYTDFQEYAESGKGIPSLREMKRIAKESMAKDFSRNLYREVRMVSKTRDAASKKLSYLYQQLTEFTYERAFREKGLTEKNILLYRGDPSARIVFLMKSPNFYDTQDAESPYAPKLSRSQKTNGLGLIQQQLHLAVRNRILKFYKNAGKKVTIRELDDAIKHMVPILTGDCSTDGHDSGIAFLYCVPIHDPDQWGKKKDKQETKEHGLGGYQPYGAQKEFPTNVLTFMDYARIALRIISPIVVISTSRFTTQCLSAGMDSKKIPGMTSCVDKCKWFTIRLTTEGGKGGVAGSTTSSSAATAAVKMVYNPETKQMTKERLDAWCIRGEHPFVVGKQGHKMMPTVKTLTERVAAKLFTEFGMATFLTGKFNTITSFCYGGMDPKAKQVERKEKDKMDVPDFVMQFEGNLICKGVTAKHIQEYREKNNIAVVIGVSEETCEEEEDEEEEKEEDLQMKALDEKTGYGDEETPCLKVSAGRSVEEFPASVAQSEFWKSDLVDIIHQACVYPGVELVKNLRERKTKTSVSMLVIRTRAIKTTDSSFFHTLPRYPNVKSEESRKENRNAADKKLKEYKKVILKREEKKCKKNMGVDRFISSKRKQAMEKSAMLTGTKDDPLEKIYFLLEGFEQDTGERMETEGIRKYDAWYSMLFVPRLIVDVTQSLDHLTSAGSVDYAVFYASVLEMIERTVFSEAHRIVHQEKKVPPPKHKRGPPPFLTIGQNVKLLGRKYFGHSECTLNSQASADIQIQWIELLSDVGMKVKKALQHYVNVML